MTTLLPKRPASLPIEGTYEDRGGATYGVRGRVLVTEDNDLVVEGTTTTISAGEFGAPTGGTFRGRLEDGSEIVLAHAGLDNMNIRWGNLGAGWDLRIVGLGQADWILQEAGHEDATETSLRIDWTITHSPLLWNAAKRFFNFELDKMAAVGLSPSDVQEAIRKPRPNACSWTINDFECEVGFFEEKRPVPDAVTNYPVTGSRFVPRIKVSAQPASRTGQDVLDRLDEAQRVVDALLGCVGFLGGTAVHWYERHEQAETSPPQGARSPTVQHRAARLRLRRFPDPGPSQSRRARALAPVLPKQAVAMVERYRAGAPFTEASIDAYLLARQTPHWPSKLLLLSTALESLKELFLLHQPQRGILDDDHWKAVRRGLEAHLKKELWKVEYGDKTVRGQVKAKMGELNRPSYRQTIEAMVGACGVSLDGLEDPFAFISVRDSVVHTGQVPEGDYECLAVAVNTLEALFERLMGAWLHVETDHSVLGAP